MYQNHTLFDLPEFTSFVHDYALSDVQAGQFVQYFDLLQEWNNRMNLTALTSPADIIQFHFRDSLALADALDVKKIAGIFDVGSGGGFPGIPLGIYNPAMRVVLIEVIEKKCAFLQNSIDRLRLKSVCVDKRDWRTIIKSTEYDIDLVCARASLAPKELLKMFSPVSRYNQAQLVYWASGYWQPDEKEKPYVVNEYSYTINQKERRLVFFKNKNTK